MYHNWTVITSILVVSIIISSGQAEDSPESEGNKDAEEKARSGDGPSTESSGSKRGSRLPLTTKTEFAQLFKQKRLAQLNAVKGLLRIPKYEKKYDMISKIFSKVFELQSESKSIIENSPFIPGGDGDSDDQNLLPQDTKTLEALSSLIENCALMGDIILRFPEMSSLILKKNKPWMIMFKYCISFTKITRLTDPMTDQMFLLVEQELDLIPKHENYSNPYREKERQEHQPNEDHIVLKTQQSAKKNPSKESKDQKSKQKSVKIPKGPRFSRSEL